MLHPNGPKVSELALSCMTGPDETVSVTFTFNEFGPVLVCMVKVMVSVYVPAAKCAPRLEAVTVTGWVASLFKEPLPGLTLSQLAPPVVTGDPDQVPLSPQFVRVTVCAAGSLWPATPANWSENSTWIHGR